jgi:hypothetical protein
LKHLKITTAKVCLLASLMWALLLRAFLAWVDWPLPNSDEGTMGIMALHIQRGDLPIFFYGQHYMGALEAYIAAALFQLAGASVFTLRLGLVLLFLLFLVCMYLLTSRLYNRKFALFTLLLLTLGSKAVLSRQLSALGGYAETLLFTTLLFLLAYWLACSTSAQQGRLRLVGYTCWGLVLGLGLWSDVLILPWAICAALTLYLFCWRELLKGALLTLIAGFVLGALPLISYNIGATSGQDSWSVLISQQGTPPFNLNNLLHQLTGTLTLSIPTTTGSPFCHVDELAAIKILGFEASQAPTLQCSLFGATWSLCYLALFLLSAYLIFTTLKRALVACHYRPWQAEERSELAPHVIKATLCLAALLTLFLYVRSHSPGDEPAEYARYLICLWVIVPLVLWPLWLGAQKVKGSLTGTKTIAPRAKLYLCRGLLILITSIFCYGTYETLAEVPQALAATIQETQLIDTLTRHNISHVYSDYWTCDRLAFQSQERIICGVLAGGCTLQRGLHNRYEPYYTTVSSDPHAAYLILTSTRCDEAVALKMKGYNQPYHLFTIGEYTVYQPL